MDTADANHNDTPIFEPLSTSDPLLAPPPSETGKIPYGLRDGVVVHISELTIAERGNKCSCLCPGCNGKLQARMGPVYAHHFAHVQESHCTTAAETGIHLKAKELIASHGWVKLPGLTVTVGKEFSDSAFKDGRCERRDLVKSGTVIEFDNVLVEQYRSGITPDVIGTLSETELFIEIRVTHEVDERKRERIEQLNVSTIEIDLSGLDRMASPVDIEEALSITANAQWIYHRHEQSLRAQMAQRVEENERIYQEQLQAAREAEMQQRARREQGKDRFKQRLSAVYQALEGRLSADAPINLPPVMKQWLPEGLPGDYGQGLTVSAYDKEWMVYASKMLPVGETDRFAIAWDCHNPSKPEPYHLRELYRIAGAFCVLDISALLKGGSRTHWQDDELDAFLAGPRARHDRWYKYPESIRRHQIAFNQAQQREALKAQKATDEKNVRERAEQQARDEAERAAMWREHEQAQAERRTIEMSRHAEQRDRKLYRELQRLAAHLDAGRKLLEDIEKHQRKIQISREALGVAAPQRWHPVKELSASYPRLAGSDFDWITGQWQCLARPYPYEWVFSIHPDCLKVAVLDTFLAAASKDQDLADADVRNDLQKILAERLRQTSQPGSKAKGYSSHYYRMERWVKTAGDHARHINALIDQTSSGQPLPDSIWAEQADQSLEEVLSLISQSAGISAGEREGESYNPWQPAVMRRFCETLLQDLRSLRHPAQS
ncbi:competence protein CoiA family protein [Halomonas sp. HP20-15]|uniref:competence protein CoiA family protein n=1 Tax=Halomonas sp. HP20-15 TaxID=3085901 RepID=UPI002981ED9F|nr:competence protein CoiA family protein [Halomonas sp. HP20-15]MDW5376409.1 competence protein CoiA family protein [Halomonas sp. HP20-15]